MFRPVLASVALATGIAGALGPVRAQEDAPTPDRTQSGDEIRFSDSYRLRTDTSPLEESRRGSEQPLGAEARERSATFERDLRAPGDEQPAEPQEPGARPRTATEELDLFAGPTPSRRENLPDTSTPAAPAQPLNRQAADRRGTQAGERLEGAEEPNTDPTSQPLNLFRAVGPVRSPTLDTRLGRGTDAGLDQLRRILPRSPDDPFAPVGLRLGSFVLYPTLEQGVGVSDNLTNTIDGARGAFSETTLGARLLSDWSRNEAEINALATYRRNFSGPLKEEPRIDLDGRLRLDIDRDWTATLRGALRFDRDDTLDTGAATTASRERDILAYSAGATLGRAAGPLHTDLDLSAVREDRDDGLFDGLALRTDDSYTTWSAGLRAGYDIAPPLRPFVGASVGRRLFDEDTAALLDRDSVIPALRAGLGFDWGEKLSGEVALGYAWNLPDEDALETTASPTLDATVNWSPRRGTDVLLRAETFFEPDTTGLATSTLYQGSIGLRHRATARIDWDGRLIAALRDGPVAGDEHLYAAETGLTYWLNRTLALTARYRYDRFDSPLAGQDYDANTVRVGVRLQR
ncbi:outer membrane beta-barrel protein [Aureimonas sp. ME7]|uniref:outer membrane beta-barrel protein n=1 Tax=Aureimonas sp. ME7 TaxID=2744252 RepID=UPI0015F6C837|nr:outer membrane beta-barrel protein [Aureimonas sp. ME7]